MSTVFLCRASGEGSHNFKVCDGELAVFAFYREMFGEEDGGGITGAIDHFRDADNWGNDGTSYECKLYCATFEVWKVDPQELAFARPEEKATASKLTVALNMHHRNAIDAINGLGASQGHVCEARRALEAIKGRSEQVMKDHSEWAPSPQKGPSGG